MAYPVSPCSTYTSFKKNKITEGESFNGKNSNEESPVWETAASNLADGSQFFLLREATIWELER